MKLTGDQLQLFGLACVPEREAWLSVFYRMDNPLLWNPARWRRTIISPFVSKVGIVYGRNTGHVRQHVYSETDDAWYEWYRGILQVNEVLCFVPMTAHLAGHEVFWRAIRDEVLRHGGRPAIFDIYEAGARPFARVDPRTGIVVSINLPDATIPGDLDVMQNVDVWIEVKHGEAYPGWVYDWKTKTFSAPSNSEYLMAA